MIRLSVYYLLNKPTHKAQLFFLRIW